jgi:hypothetical protein
MIPMVPMPCDIGKLKRIGRGTPFADATRQNEPCGSSAGEPRKETSEILAPASLWIRNASYRFIQVCRLYRLVTMMFPLSANFRSYRKSTR